MNNFVVIILDGIGVGELPDAHKYGDAGSNTLGNISKVLGSINLPNLQMLGLGNIIDIAGVPKTNVPLASYGKMKEISRGKDSTTGHWEISGIKVDYSFPLYPMGFSKDIIDKFLLLTGLKGVLGNKAASGTEIINELGDEHIKSGFPIIYTSADSVFQVAAHEDIIPIEELYKICKTARDKVFTGDDTIGRVIARPFIGGNGNYSRTTNRKDYSIDPIKETILDVLTRHGIYTVAIGKINDLFNNRGIQSEIHTKSNPEGVLEICRSIKKHKNSFIFANLVDFDVYFGHRNDPTGFYNCLKEFDDYLPQILGDLDESDFLVITSDHGNDPTDISTDHTREYVPLLFYMKNKFGKDLGTRETFSDVACTVADFFNIAHNLPGKSFYS